MIRTATIRLAALLSLLAVAGVARAEVLALGAAAPMTDTKMMNVDGKEVAIADVKGKNGTLVIFSCNACPYAKAWEERIVTLGNEFAKRGVGVIMINSNDPNVAADDSYDVMKQRAESRAMQFPYVVDATSDVARAYGATRTPEAFLFDKKGKLVYHGAIDDNSRDASAVKATYLKDALTAVAAGKKIKTTETKSIGCSIKFRSASKT
jgi:peroxiredoxin